MIDNPNKARLESIQIRADRGDALTSDMRWLLGMIKTLGLENTKLRIERDKYKTWHENNKEIIGQQARFLQEANAHVDELERQSYGQGQ